LRATILSTSIHVRDGRLPSIAPAGLRKRQKTITGTKQLPELGHLIKDIADHAGRLVASIAESSHLV